MPWSIGCNLDVVLGEKYSIQIDFSSGSLLWPCMLYRKEEFCIFWVKFILSSSFSQLMHISCVTHALGFGLGYLTGNVTMSLKHLGFQHLPITSSFSFSLPSILVLTTTVILSLQCLPPVHISFLNFNILFDKSL